MSFYKGDTVRVAIDPNQNIHEELSGFVEYRDVDDRSDDIDFIINLMKPNIIQSKWIESSVISSFRQVLLEKAYFNDV